MDWTSFFIGFIAGQFAVAVAICFFTGTKDDHDTGERNLSRLDAANARRRGLLDG